MSQWDKLDAMHNGTGRRGFWLVFGWLGALALCLGVGLLQEAPGTGPIDPEREARSRQMFEEELRRARQEQPAPLEHPAQPAPPHLPGQVQPSSGCQTGSSAPLNEFSVAGLRLGLITVPSAQPTTPQPLVLAFHGRTGDAAQVRRYYGLEETGLEESGSDAVFAYPAAPRLPGGADWQAVPGGGAALFDALLETLAERYCLDLNRVYAVGHSLGASYVNALGCLRGDRLRAIATVAGGRPNGDCTGTVAALIAHNPQDELVPFSEGLAARDAFLAQNALTGEYGPSEPSFLACRRHGGALAAFPVLWCPHDVSVGPRGTFYPHTWPRGTGAAMMAFFEGLP